MTNADAQRALITLGYNLGKGGPSGRGDDNIWGNLSRLACGAFQRQRSLSPTGLLDAPTIAALQEAVARKAAAEPSKLIPPAWLPAGRLERIIVHWTAGSNKASGLDKAHYHLLIEGDGTLIRGQHSIASNAIGAIGARASHTLNCNTGSIGVSLCGMAGAQERPFLPGRSPITAVQWQTLPEVLAELCRRYSIPVTPRTVLSHAEVEPNLGIKQKGKWDISRVPSDPALIGARLVGDAFRAATQARL